MSKPIEYLISITWVVVCLFAVVLVCECIPDAYGHDSEPTGITDELLDLQPALPARAAERLSAAFVVAGRQYGHDPLLLASMAMRESSLSREVGHCERVGALGEMGLMQLHGVAARLAPCSDQCDPICSIRSGAYWLAQVREQCPGSTWRWVASYGWSRCTTEEEARADTAARRARDLYLSVGGERWE